MISGEPLDESYLNWLYSQVASVRTRAKSRTYWKLLRALFTVEFQWIVPNDDNRLEDGRALRLEFLEARGIRDADPAWLQLGCSFLEVLVALSRRLSFETDETNAKWFWVMIENLGMELWVDSKELCEAKVDRIVNQVIWRTYRPNGDGGLFPLKNPRRDQRTVEIWYQLNEYLIEHGYA